MSTCEKCWHDAEIRMLFLQPPKSQTDHYLDLMNERRDDPCNEMEQRGEFSEIKPPTGHEG